MCSENFQMLDIYLRVKKNNPRFTDLTLGFAFQQFQAVPMEPPIQFFFNCFYLMKQWIFKFTEMKKKKKKTCHHGSIILLTDQFNAPCKEGLSVRMVKILFLNQLFSSRSVVETSHWDYIPHSVTHISPCHSKHKEFSHPGKE